MGNIVATVWFILILFPSAILYNVVSNFLKNDPYMGLISLGIAVIVFFSARYRYLSSLRRNTTFKYSRFFMLYPDKLVVESENGSRGVFNLTDLQSVRSLKTDYQFALKTKGAYFWIPKSAFNSEADRQEFERVLGLGVRE